MTLAVVTGANRGIGLELTRQLRQRGTDVVAVCRQASPELNETGAEVVEGIDVTEAKDLQRLAGLLEGRQVDLLINNAGVLRSNRLGDLDADSIRTQFAVNALGPLLLSEALLPALKRGSKLALVTSRMGSIADNTSGGSYGYRMSKAALNAAGKSLANDLSERGVAVVLLHPGYVRTDMTGKSGHVDPDESARQLLERIDALTLEQSGRFLHANGENLPW